MGKRRIGGALLDCLRTLHSLGVVGNRSDGELLDLFTSKAPEVAEQAFAALVDRHGPMVLGVCRRTLGNHHAAEDAFQAVFLVLARKARSVRNQDSIGGWLHRVARRVAGRAARNRRRIQTAEEPLLAEVATMREPSKAIDPAELKAAIDEEIDRLGTAQRQVVVLCDLEGLTQEQAAVRLNWPVGTVKSRLSRARTKLRTRLDRRGFAPATLLAATGALWGTKAATAAVPKALAGKVVEAALPWAIGSSTAIGTIPATVATLTQGELQSMFLIKIKATLLVFATAGVAAGLAIGSAWVPGNGVADEPKQANVETKQMEPEEEKSDWTIARGIVVDEEGRPVVGAAVEAVAGTSVYESGVTDAEGRFALELRWPTPWNHLVLAKVDDGRRIGFGTYPTQAQAPEGPGDLRIVLGPSREVVVQVADEAGEPVNVAVVDALGLRSMVWGMTGPDGRAILRLPPEAPIDSLIALKPRQGFDYFDHTQARRGLLARDLPDEVSLVLNGARIVRVGAIDTNGEPIAGADVYPWLLSLAGKAELANVAGSRFVRATTGEDGFATFDWLPPETTQPVTFWVRAEGYYAPERTVLEPDAPEAAPLVSEQYRKGAIRGRITLPNGGPAEGIRVEAQGTGGGFANSSKAEARTAADGTYEIAANPTLAYIVAVIDDEWAAPSHIGVVIREGEEVEGIDFPLGQGAIIEGTVTLGSDREPVERQSVNIIQSGGRIPDELERGDRFWHEVQHSRGAYTDAQGHFEIRVGPGTYSVRGPTRTETQEVEAIEGGRHVIDFHMDRPAQGPIVGRVVLAADPTRGVAGATVVGVSADPAHNPGFNAETDAEGHFQAERYLDKMVVHARTPENDLAGIIKITGETEEVTIPVGPTATASGHALDESGAPMAEQKLDCGTRVYLGEPPGAPFRTTFSPAVTTDAEGRFTLPGMVIGHLYSISYYNEEAGHYKTFTQLTPTEPGEIDLGPLKLGEYREPRSAEELSSFRPDAPDAGAPAPPIEATTLNGEPLSLEDYRGRYVLLDFWATWCGPCIAEIPHLQEVYEKFGRDDRFALLSLSVDEEIDAPRAFQETRQLPWDQGFLGEGIHSPTLQGFGVRAIPALVLVGPDGTIVARGMRGDQIREAVAEALGR